MIGRWLELSAGPFRASWRAGLGWLLAFAFLVVSTVAFWPAFQQTTSLSDLLKQVPPAMLQAFGLEDFDTAAGYLRGGLYEVIVPLMFAAAGVMFVSTATAGDEDGGRLEILLAQPVTRQALFVGRALAILAWLGVLAVAVLISQFASDAVFGLEIADDRLVATIVLCGLLGTFHAGFGLAIAGLTARPSLVLSLGLGLALAGYVVAALFPLSAPLAAWSGVSPWDWALGGDPLVNPTEGWRYLALAVPSVALAGFGVVAFTRRDVRSA